MSQENKKKHSILLVDDDHFLLTMYADKFKAAGFEIEVMGNSRDALDKIKSGYVPEVIMLDVVMPGMDGLELLKNIRDQKLASSSKIIMLSNQSQEDDIQKAKSMNVAGYIVKATTIPTEVVTETIRIIEG